MYIARWHFTAREGQTDACLALLRKWAIDVGERIGWKLGSIRISQGAIGASQGHFELEVQLDALSDLESAWNDMKGVPYHQQYQKDLEPLLVSGSMRWTVARLVELAPED